MRKQKFIIFITAIGWIALMASEMHGQMSEEEKKRLFLEAREDIRPLPKASVTPRPKPRPASTPTPPPKATQREIPKETPRPTPPTPEPTSEKTPEEKEGPPSRPSPTPKSKRESSPGDVIPLPDEIIQSAKNDRPKPHEDTSPPHTPPPHTKASQATKSSERPSNAPIVVEKSGLEEQQGYEPPPKKERRGFFARWRYLTPSVRRAIDQARVRKGRWKYIVVHNSGTRQGNARIFDLYHRRVRKMQNGLAYHFVIGNGHSSGDGEIEIGNRWTRQINGGHVASDYLNNIALGICLVGDFNRDRPTKNQLAALEELITYLRTRVGKIKGKPAIVRGHKQINPKPTDCPGDRFPLGWLRQKFGS